jgi:hypothetical protein
MSIYKKFVDKYTWQPGPGIYDGVDAFGYAQNKENGLEVPKNNLIHRRKPSLFG